MDINEIGRKIVELKSEVTKLIQKFESETSCKIDDISIDRVYTMGNISEEIIHINTKVVIE